MRNVEKKKRDKCEVKRGKTFAVRFVNETPSRRNRYRER
jgi:hypothetical protein